MNLGLRAVTMMLIVAWAKRHGGELPRTVRVPRCYINELRSELDLSASMPVEVGGVLVEEHDEVSVLLAGRERVS